MTRPSTPSGGVVNVEIDYLRAVGDGYPETWFQTNIMESNSIFYSPHGLLNESSMWMANKIT